VVDDDLVYNRRVDTPAKPPIPASRLPLVELAGKPRAMGEAFGEQFRAEIGSFYRLRTLNALAQAQQFGGRRVGERELLSVAAQSLSVSESYDPDGFAELAGIARAANLSVEQVFAMNGLTDLRDVLAWSSAVPGYGLSTTDRGIDGCTSIVLAGDVTDAGTPLGGQTWDLATDNMPYVVAVHRRPKDAPETWALTTVGCLSLIGLNAEGLAIGTTNLRTRDARPGICYLSIIHRALSRRGFDGALAAIDVRHRAAAHYYWVASRDGRVAGVECTATRAARVDVPRGAYIHTNHVLDPENAKLEGNPPKPEESTVFRAARLAELVDARARARRGWSLDSLRDAFADHAHGEGAICRHDYAGVSSNGAVVVDLARPAIWATRGTPCVGTWVDLLTGEALEASHGLPQPQRP
jgi:isopenicillin-N N-acyltransferase-like protein